MPGLQLDSKFPILRVVEYLLATAPWAPDGMALALGQAVQGGNYGTALMWMFLAGVATSLTPCVYPMIAITVSVFGARKVDSRLQAAGLSTAFVAGMVTLFVPLGLMAALTGGVFGEALAHPAVAGFVALVFLALALSMLGLFEIQLPARFRNRVATVGGSGFRGAFGLGLVSALVSAPCTGPVLAFILTWIGQQGAVTFGGLALLSYGLGLGLLFWWVGTFAVALPKSGAWMEWVKSAFAVVILVMAVHYVQDFFPLPIPLVRQGLWLGAGIAIVTLGALLGGVHLSFHHSRWQVRARKAGGVALMVLGATCVWWYVEGLPPGAKIQWQEDYGNVRAQAMERQQPVLVDFGASWCEACGELDRDTFSDPRVVRRVKELGLAAVKVDLSAGKNTPQKKAWLAQYSQRGLPFVVLHRRDGTEAARLSQFVDAAEFVHWLENTPL